MKKYAITNLGRMFEMEDFDPKALENEFFFYDIVNYHFVFKGICENKSFEELYHEACDKRLYLGRSKLVKEM